MPLMAELISLLTHSPDTTVRRIALQLHMKIVHAPHSRIIPSAVFTVLVEENRMLEVAKCID